MNNNQKRPGPGKNPQQKRGMTREQFERLSPEERAKYNEYVRRKRAEAERRRRAAAEAEAARQQALLREQEQKKKERRAKLRVFAGRALIFLAVLLVLCIIAAVIFVIHFNSTPAAPKDSGKIMFYYGGKAVREAPAADTVTADGIYICFNDLANYLGMSESGTADQMKFILKTVEGSQATSEGTGTEEYIIFISDGYGVIINGQNARLEIPNKLVGTEVWVTADFVEDYMLNLSVTYNEKNGSVKVARMKDEENSSDDLTVYLPVSFALKSTAPMPSVDDPDDPNDGSTSPDPEPADTTPAETEDPVLAAITGVQFITDLSAYEKYMNPEGDLRDSFLILVNTKNHLTANDIPPDLTAPIYRNWENKPLREYAARALEALFLEFNASGFANSNLAVRSAYRDYANQDYLFNYYTQRELSRNPSLTREEAETIVLTFSTRPGTSEHQTGLAVDMDTTGTLVTDFQYSEEYKWLNENAWKFGFVLRFPADKTHITTIQFEPWHYRYVGRYHAYKIHEAGICLEEYIELLKGE
ncbi:MAG: D-alanyl-D-alanine carboxypeptidase family protein [Ruminococcaceae bacterium]|nr:D-alanyl-D-alanine carboxypeptidase family protein [Oscillospiraceae bacterium]